MSGRLDGKVALVSGAAGGIGAAAVDRLAQEGATIVAGDLDEDRGAGLASEHGEAVRFVRLDVTHEDSWQAAVQAAESTFGRLDVLVNNAGVLGFGALRDTSLDDYRRVIEVNQVGVFLGMKWAIPALERAGGGSIVNTSSIEGIGGMPYTAAYTASKFAVRGMTKSAALELGAAGIRVNSVHPGVVDTNMVRAVAGGPDADLSGVASHVPLGRVAQPVDVANVMVFLASDESAYCTGAEFIVDGGATASSGFHLGGSP